MIDRPFKLHPRFACHVGPKNYCPTCLRQPQTTKPDPVRFPQLVQYSFEAVAAKDGPPEKLTLYFSTADVVIAGWRLDRLVGELRCNKGGIVKTLPNATRYEQLEPNACAIASIDIKPVGKE